MSMSQVFVTKYIVLSSNTITPFLQLSDPLGASVYPSANYWDFYLHNLQFQLENSGVTPLADLSFHSSGYLSGVPHPSQ